MWAKAGLSTEPASRAYAEDLIRDLYRVRGLRPPGRFVWAGSPHAAMRAVNGATAAGAHKVERDRILPSKLRDIARDERFWLPLRSVDDVLRPVRDVGNQIMAEAVPDPPRSLWPLSDLVSDTAWNDTVLRFADPRSPRMVLGQFDASVIATYEMRHYPRAYQLPYIEPEETAAVALVSRIARCAGPWWPFEETVVVCERPRSILLDDQRRLHNGTGPAVTYPDGWTVYAWHGVRVPPDLIEEPSWTTERILREPNAEVRRAAIERIGWEEFIPAAGLEPVGPPVPDPGNPGQMLALYDAPAGLYRARIRVLLCTNGSLERDGTRRRFGLTVPGHIKDPIEAAAWTFGWTRERYAALEHRR
jgi:hypothetical protein